LWPLPWEIPWLRIQRAEIKVFKPLKLGYSIGIGFLFRKEERKVSLRPELFGRLRLRKVIRKRLIPELGRKELGQKFRLTFKGITRFNWLGQDWWGFSLGGTPKG